jgi:prefoldin subunit 5
MHGYYGAYRILERLIDEALDEGRRRRENSYDRPPDRRAEIEQEIKLMYARGDIEADSYHRLRELARSGALSWSELKRVHQESSASKAASKPARATQPESRRKRDAEIVNSLNRLYTHRSRLDQARTETEQVLQKLEKDVTRLREQARTAGEQAQQALPDEARARDYLETKQEIMERIQVLEERVRGLQESLHRIDDLRGELATRETELKALESGQELADLEASIRADLLNDE